MLEEQARQQAVEDARAAVGEFPPLAGASPGEGDGVLRPSSHPVNQTHKVVSISSKKGGKVTVTSYMPPVSSTSLSSVSRRRGEDVGEPEVKRVPAPAAEVEPVGRGLKVAVYVPSKPQGMQGGSRKK